MSFLLVLVVLVAIASAGCRPIIAQTRVSETIALANVTVIDGTGAPPRPNMTIVIRDGRIRSIEPSSRSLTQDATVIPLRNKFIIPGLIDAHVHLGTQPRPDGVMAAILRAAFLGGVTSVRDMGGRLDIIRPLALQGNSDTSAMPRVRYSAIVAGPGMWFDGERARFFHGDHAIGTSPGIRRIDASTDIPRVIAEVKRTGASAIKIYNTIEPALLHRLATEARRQGLAVWSHSYVDPGAPSDVVKAGASVVSHADGFIYELLPEVVRRSTRDSVRAARQGAFLRRPLESQLIRGLVDTMRVRGTILDATLMVMRPAPDSAGRIDRRHAALFHAAVDFVRLAHRSGVDVAAGTDALGGSSPNIHAELQLLVDSAGFSPLQALRSATLVSARALGMADSVGTIAVGKVADLVILDRDPTADIANTLTVSAVMKAGRLVRRDRPLGTPPMARPPRPLSPSGSGDVH
jgi:hypothetical protein